MGKLNRWLENRDLLVITLVGVVNILSAPLAGYLFDLLGAYWLYAFSMAGYLLGYLVLRLARA